MAVGWIGFDSRVRLPSLGFDFPSDEDRIGAAFAPLNKFGGGTEHGETGRSGSFFNRAHLAGTLGLCAVVAVFDQEVPPGLSIGNRHSTIGI